MFLQYTLCTGPGQKVFTPVGAGSYQWPVIVNGSATACFDPDCPSDFNQDRFVNGDDLAVLLGAWGTCVGPCRADLNQDGFVDGADLGVLLNSWGPCPA
jgi:hypothetical protein